MIKSQMQKILINSQMDNKRYFIPIHLIKHMDDF